MAKLEELVCKKCGKKFTRIKNKVDARRYMGQKDFFCSRECSQSYQTSRRECYFKN